MEKCSALTGEGIPALWTAIARRHAAMAASGALAERRRGQARIWLRNELEQGLMAMLRASPAIAERLPAVEAQVEAGTLSPPAAARALLQGWRPAASRD